VLAPLEAALERNCADTILKLLSLFDMLPSDPPAVGQY
jgi:hypothetical protein